MSLLGSVAGGLLAGAGAGAADVATSVIDQNNKIGLQNNAAGIQLGLADHQAQIARDQEAFVDDLRQKSYVNKTNFDNSPDQVAADAARAGAVTGAQTAAKEANTTLKLSPGERAVRADGSEIARNNTITAPELYEQNYKSQGGAGAGAASAAEREAMKEAAAQRKQDQDQLFKALPAKDFTDATGKLDASGYSLVTTLAGAELSHGSSPAEAASKAQAAKQYADDFAHTLAQTNAHWYTTKTDDAAREADLKKQVYAKLLANDPNPFDAGTYAPRGPASAKSAPSAATAPAAAPVATSPADSPTPAPARNGATSGAAPNGAIPDAPDRTIVGADGRPKVNPDYAEWQSKFGDAWRAQRSSIPSVLPGKAMSLMDQVNQFMLKGEGQDPARVAR